MLPNKFTHTIPAWRSTYRHNLLFSAMCNPSRHLLCLATLVLLLNISCTSMQQTGRGNVGGVIGSASMTTSMPIASPTINPQSTGGAAGRDSRTINITVVAKGGAVVVLGIVAVLSMALVRNKKILGVVIEGIARASNTEHVRDSIKQVALAAHVEPQLHRLVRRITKARITRQLS